MLDDLEIPLTMKPMEAELTDQLPAERGWQFEPKRDGFRALVFRAGGEGALRSRNQRPLERFFPELIEAILQHPRDRFVLDAEIVLPDAEFEALQLRLHPAASRVERLAREHPAQLVCFDLLADREGRSLLQKPFRERRAMLERFFSEFGAHERMQLIHSTHQAADAYQWLDLPGVDGIMAKRLDQPYQSGRRAMLKFKERRTVDCVVGGFYWDSRKRGVDSLLLGLYDPQGTLHYVGRARIYRDSEQYAELLEPLLGGEGFTGRSPAATDRWSGKKRKYEPLDPVLVAEVSTDHITNRFMRHGARVERWRTDKSPQDCSIDQIAGPQTRKT